jgi:hypothetical protein
MILLPSALSASSTLSNLLSFFLPFSASLRLGGELP